MSIASLQYMKLTNSPSTNRPVFKVRCSQADGGQLRRPSVATPVPVVSPLPEKMLVPGGWGEEWGDSDDGVSETKSQRDATVF